MKNNTYGKKVKLFRLRAKLTQLELELRINASFGSISRIENGITNPTKETLLEIAGALGLNSLETAFLFGIDIKQKKELTILELQSDKIP